MVLHPSTTCHSSHTVYPHYVTADQKTSNTGQHQFPS